MEYGTKVATHPGNVIESERRLGLEYVHVQVPILIESRALRSEVYALRYGGSTQGEREKYLESLSLNPSQRSTVGTVDGSWEYVLPIQDSLQKDDPFKKGQTQTNVLTTGRRCRVVSTCEGKLIYNNNDESIKKFDNYYELVIGDARCSVSYSRSNSIVKVPCSDDTPMASHDTGSYYSETSHLDREDNSIGTSPKPIGK